MLNQRRIAAVLILTVYVEMQQCNNVASVLPIKRNFNIITVTQCWTNVEAPLCLF